MMGAKNSTETTQSARYGQTGISSDKINKISSQNVCTNYETSFRPAPFRDNFVRQKLNECNCISVLQVFVDNEIDQTAFLLLSEEDLKSLLPGKLGPIKKIWELIQRLNNKETEVKPSQSIKEIDIFQATQPSAVNTALEIYHPPQTPITSLVTEQESNKVNTFRWNDDAVQICHNARYQDSRHMETVHLDSNNPDASPSVPSGYFESESSSLLRPSTLNSNQFSLNVQYINYYNQIQQNQNLLTRAHQDENDDSGKKPETRDFVSDKRIDRRSFQRKSDQHNTAKSRSMSSKSEQPNLGVKCNKWTASAQPTGGTKRKKNPSTSKKASLLPIYKYKNDFLRLVEQNAVVIVIAETGSGKSTQMPQYLANTSYKKKIICTQPRRLAAKSLAKRVAYEFGSKLGEEVGYRVRFDNRTENTTKISYVTEGVLVHELAMDVTASNYSVIVIDEAHERNLNTDVLLGFLKKAIALRSDLKVVISSATVEGKKFSKYFNNAPVLDIPGRSFQVDIFYTDTINPDYLHAVVRKVCEIHRSNGLGDILAFLPGQEGIENAAETITREIALNKNTFFDAMVLPLYSKLPSEQQNFIFDPAPPNTRKIILATNIAETSLTIDGVVYVVDSGLVKQAEYITKANGGALECTTLVTIPITKAQAKQRSGRAGRTQKGVAYRLYSEATYNKMDESPIPEILRGNLEMIVLLLYSMGIKNILEFDFIDSPPKDALLTAIEKLEEFGALIRTGSSHEYTLTNVGRQMSSFPIEPYLSKMLIVSANIGCSEEVLTIIAILSAQVDKLFKRPKEKLLEANLAKKNFHCWEGDHITLLNVYNQWLPKMNKKSKGWCNEKFLDWRTLKEAYEIRCQLSTMLDEKKIVRKSCRGDMTMVQMAIASGSFRKVAWKVRAGTYYSFSSPTQEPVHIHPSSSLFLRSPPLVIYNSIIKTNKAYMCQVLEVDMEHIRKYADKFSEKLIKVIPSHFTDD